MYIQTLPTMPCRYRGFIYVIDRDQSNTRRKQTIAYVVRVTDPKTGQTHSIGHGYSRIVEAGRFARAHIDAIANTRQGWSDGK